MGGIEDVIKVALWEFLAGSRSVQSDDPALSLQNSKDAEAR